MCVRGGWSGVCGLGLLGPLSNSFRASLEGWVSVAATLNQCACVFSIPLNNDVCSLYTSGLRLLVWALGCDGQ